MANDKLFPQSWSEVSPACIVFWCESGLMLMQMTMLVRCVAHFSGKSAWHWRIKRRMKIANLMCHCLIILSTLMDILHAYGTLTTDSRWLVTGGWTLWIHMLADVLYYLESLALYGVLIYRLTLTFSETLFAVRYRDLISVFSMMATQSGFYAIYVYYLTLAENEQNDLSKHRRTYIIGTVKPVLGGFITVIGWLIDGYLVRMFVVRLHNFVVDSAINYRSITSPYSQGLMFAIAKQTVLGTEIVLISQLFFTVQFVLYMAGRRDHFAMFLAPLYLSRALDGLISQCLLDLSFSYSTGIYLTFCGVCHKYVSSRQQSSMQKRVSIVINSRVEGIRAKREEHASSEPLLMDEDDNPRNNSVVPSTRRKRTYSFSISTIVNNSQTFDTVSNLETQWKDE